MANLTDVMDQLGVGLSTITGLRVYDFPPLSAQPPFAFVDMPESLEFDLSAARGSDRAEFPVVVCVSAAVDRVMRDQLAAYAAGAGPLSVRAALDSATVGQSLRVMSVEFRPVTLSSGTYAGAIFSVDVTF